MKAIIQSHATLTQALRTPDTVTRGTAEKGSLCGNGVGALTLGFQLLLLFAPPCIVVIFRQLFCHGLGVDAKGSRPTFRGCSQIKGQKTHLQLPRQGNSTEIGGLRVVAFPCIIGLG